MALVLASWKSAIQRLPAEWHLVLKGSLLRVWSASKLLFTCFLPITFIPLFIRGAGIMDDFVLVLAICADIGWVALCVALSRSSVTRKDWRYLCSYKICGGGIAWSLLMFIGLLGSLIVPLLLEARYGFTLPRMIFAGIILPRVPCYGLFMSLMALVLFYLFDSDRLLLRSAVGAAGKAFKGWIYYLPIWLMIELMHYLLAWPLEQFLLRRFYVGIVVVATWFIPSVVIGTADGYRLLFLTTCGALASILPLLIRLWYAAALAVYYESIRFREE